MSDSRFRVFFCSSRESFNTPTTPIQNDSIFRNRSKNPQKAVEVQLATALYFLKASDGAVFRGVAQLWIGEGTTHLYCHQRIAALVHLLPWFLIWPGPGSIEYRQIRSGVEQSSGFPEHVGFLDVTDIVRQRSQSYHGETYLNCKKQYRLNIQAICNSNTRFTFVSWDYSASVGDATLFSGTSSGNNPICFFPVLRNTFLLIKLIVILDTAWLLIRRVLQAGLLVDIGSLITAWEKPELEASILFEF